jgi:hypothetical protein
MSSKIQQKLWALANYDCFLMQYCPTLYNKVAGIGVFFLFQMLIVFCSVVTAYYVLFPTYLILGWLLAIIATYVFYKWFKFSNNVHHSSVYIRTLIMPFCINLALALLLSIPFYLSLFEHQILFQLYLKTEKINFGIIEQLWLKPYGLYESWFVDNEGNIILFICIAIFILIAFIFIAPHVLIYTNRKSPYHLIKQNYVQKFSIS